MYGMIQGMILFLCWIVAQRKYAEKPAEATDHFGAILTSAPTKPKETMSKKMGAPSGRCCVFCSAVDAEGRSCDSGFLPFALRLPV